MPIYLNKRDLLATELMDNPDCDKILLFNTYKQFIPINKIFSGWHSVYKKLMLPLMQKNPGQTYSVLDVGCGGGDILCELSDFAKKDGIKLELLGIDPDVNAGMFRKTQSFPVNIKFSQCFLKDLLASNKKYDFIINNNVVHHLSSEQLQDMLQDAKILCNKMIIFNDIERSDLAYLFFPIIASIYRNSFARVDGAISIKRSYTKTEMAALLPDDWKVRRMIPFRLLTIYENK